MMRMKWGSRNVGMMMMAVVLTLSHELFHKILRSLFRGKKFESDKLMISSLVDGIKAQRRRKLFEKLKNIFFRFRLKRKKVSISSLLN